MIKKLVQAIVTIEGSAKVANVNVFQGLEESIAQYRDVLMIAQAKDNV